MKFMKIGRFLIILSTLIFCSGNESPSDNSETPTPNPPTVTNDVDFWLTKGDESVKLAKQTGVIAFNSPVNSLPYIDVTPTQTFQTVDGFGYTLTGGSVEVINRLTEAKRNELLQELFGSGENSIGVSYLRLSIGASDLSSEVYSYNDLPTGQTDEDLSEFSVSKDQPVIEMLKKILAINPTVKIIAAPWSAPVWMKTNGSFIGGKLKPEYYAVYGQYFVKYIQAMKAQGITITAVTPQNEPLHDGNNPSLVMTATEQAAFIKTGLGPAFQAAGLTTKIVVYDHNCDRPNYPTTILSDPQAAAFVDGSAFHLYAGDIGALSTVHNAFPTKNIYFTEQYTASTGSFSGDLLWHVKNVIVGSMRNWSKNALEWNLANDGNYKPHTEGGCTTCKGAITVNSSENISKNVAYYIIAHASKFVPAGSVRIQSSVISNINNVAFRIPSGKIVMIAGNDSSAAQNFNVRVNGRWALFSLPGNSVATYIF